MNKIKATVMAVLVALTVYPAAGMAQYEMYSPSRLLAEFADNASQARQLEAELKANITTKDAYARELQVITRDSNSYLSDKAVYDKDLAAHNEDVDAFNAQCGSGTFDQAALTRCETLEAGLKSAQAALDTRRGQLESQRQAINQRKDAYNQKESARAQAAEALLSRYDEYDSNNKTIMALLLTKEEFRDSDCASRPSPEAMHQCLVQVMGRQR